MLKLLNQRLHKIFLGVSKYAQMGVMTMPVCNMDHNASAQTLDHKEIVKKDNAHMVVQETAVSKCVVVLGT